MEQSGTGNTLLMDLFMRTDVIIHIGELEKCVRTIGTHINDKYTDPVVINIDSTGRYILPVLSGYIGDGIDICKKLSELTTGELVDTSIFDNSKLWDLDLLAEKYDWLYVADDINGSKNAMDICKEVFQAYIPTALLLDIKNEGTEFLEKSHPEHVDVYYKYSDIKQERYGLILTVGPFIYEAGIPMVSYFPRILHLGIGSTDVISGNVSNIYLHIISTLIDNNINPESIISVSGFDLDKDESVAETLAFAVMGCPYVKLRPDKTHVGRIEDFDARKMAEAAAISSAGGGILLLESTFFSTEEDTSFYYAIAMDKSVRRKGHVEIVGAGPRNAGLISVQGLKFIGRADLILYAGSKIDQALFEHTKEEAVCYNFSGMEQDEQFRVTKDFYERGKLIVRLHAGDPCIYSSISKQLARYDLENMSYHITPGISAFQAAAAALHTPFTIPGKVESVLLTNGGKGKEYVQGLATGKNTMCIYLTADIAAKIQQELLYYYMPETPIALCYKLTWKDERIFYGVLKDLSTIMLDNGLNMNTLLVIGKVLDNLPEVTMSYIPEKNSVVTAK
ncbi:MAG: SAM-dependent methyltransferase [Tannerellaceae bacterium]|nr:SAM-dependent methyltransferase [Tannerellaceae bacterium]